jgi:hypothetical protein
VKATEDTMSKMHLAAGLVAASLLLGPAFGQDRSAPAAVPSGMAAQGQGGGRAGQFIAEQPNTSPRPERGSGGPQRDG